MKMSALLLALVLVFGDQKEALPTLDDLSNLTDIVTFMITARQENQNKKK
ncbi:hypothetical protein [Robertmurraya sp.]